jgi:hypothetical protein
MIASMRYHLFCLYFCNKGNIFTNIVMICFESHLPFYGQMKYIQTKQLDIPILHILYIWVTRRVSYKKQELLTLHEHLSSPPAFGGVRVGHLLVVLCYPIKSIYVLSSLLSVTISSL